MDRYPPIAEHGLIGDLQTAALVTTDGTVDWWCCPRFDSPSVFASLLDHDNGGHGHHQQGRGHHHHSHRHDDSGGRDADEHHEES